MNTTVKTRCLVQDILQLYEANPFLIETAEGIARRIGRDSKEIRPILSDLVADSKSQMREENNSVIYVNHDRQSRRTQVRIAPSGDRLTTREDEVLRLLLAGGTYASIAEELKITVHTVKNHVNSVYRKMEVCSRAELFSQLNLAGHLGNP